MRTPLYPLIAAALLFTAAPALAHDGDDGAADGGAINCPLTHAAPAHHHPVHHVRRSGGCPTQATGEEHRRMAWAGEAHRWAPPAPRGGEDEYGRQNFSWAPTGPGDEHPGPSTWRPGPPAQGLYGAPPAPMPSGPPPAYAQRGYDRDGYGARGYDQRGVDQRDQAEREFSERFADGAARGNYSSGWTMSPPAERGYGERDLGHGVDQHGMVGREYAYGYSREEEKTWSSHQGGVFIQRRTCDCDGRASTTDQYGFLTWPGKTHFLRGQAMEDQPMGPPPGAMGPGGPPPWSDAPQGSVIVRP